MVKINQNLSDCQAANAMRGTMHNAQPRLTLNIVESLEPEDIRLVEGSMSICPSCKGVRN